MYSKGLQEEAPELTKDMFTASNAIASLVNVVCNQGFIYLSFEATLRAATVLQARHQPSPQNPSLSFVEPHDQFWVLIPQVVQDKHLELMGKVYQRIYKKRIQDVIEFHGRPKIGEPQAPASSWGLMSLVQGLVSYVSPAVESLRQVDFHMSGSLLSALFQVLKASDIEIYQEATEAVRKKTEEFLSIIDNEIDKSIQLNGKTSKNDKMVETTEILMELFNILDGDSKEEDKLEELEAFLNQTKNKSALLVNHIDSQMQARELLGRYQDVNPEGSAFKKLPLSTMLQVIGKESCKLMANELESNDKNNVLITGVADVRTLLTQKLFKLHCTLYDRESYSRYFALEKLIEMSSDQPAMTESFKGFAKIWVLITGIPQLPTPGWAKDIATVWREKDGKDGILTLKIHPDENHVSEWRLNTLVDVPVSQSARGL